MASKSFEELAYSEYSKLVAENAALHQECVALKEQVAQLKEGHKAALASLKQHHTPINHQFTSPLECPR